VATDVDVMLDPMVRYRLHISGAQDRREFYLIRHGIRNFFIRGGESNRDLFSLKLKLKKIHLGIPGLDMQIWQEARKKSSQWAAELEPELGPVSS
jgi:hypothetical protein